MTDTPPAIALNGSVWMTIDGKNFGGPGRIALLARIADTGSITQAAKAIGMSYKAAWDAIETMNTLAGEPLVARVSGGKGGGGTCLTARGKTLVENFRLLETEHRRYIEALGKQAEKLADDYLLLRTMSMKTSARNQFYGKIKSVTRGSVNDEVTLEITPDLNIVAIVTHECADELGLQPGAAAFALVNSSSVMLATHDQNARYSARNQLHGQIARLTPGAVNTEVAVEIAEGVTIVAIITNQSCENLALNTGDIVTALFKAPSVIIGIPG